MEQLDCCLTMTLIDSGREGANLRTHSSAVNPPHRGEWIRAMIITKWESGAARLLATRSRRSAMSASGQPTISSASPDSVEIAQSDSSS
jgi:hypothetical protein